MVAWIKTLCAYGEIKTPRMNGMILEHQWNILKRGSIHPSLEHFDSTTMDGSYYTESLHCVTMYKIINILAVIICMVGLAGNAIVLWLLGFHVHRNAFSVYVLNLAGADFLFLCFQTVLFLNQILILFKGNNVIVPLYLAIMSLAPYLSGLCMIAAISVERCLSVLWPIWYHCQRPRHTSSVVCALLWIFSLLLTLLLGLGCILLFRGHEYSFCENAAFASVVFVTALSVVPCGFNLALLVSIFCGSQRIPVTRLYVTIALTVLVFLLFGLPFSVSCMFFISTEKMPTIFSCNVIYITIFLSCVNSCANPIIYFFVGSIRHCKFQRQSLKMLLQRAMQDTPEEEDGERGSSRNPGEQETVLCSS
ncbi:mas-related G-protein coupled receptor member B4-like [Peromyscus eremicus]|uniref:mas-related G-protein coupled receptor member B4-like n=1 Tax=Peromyscus eremicus TaxID=42410 RepID=UPI0027DD0C2C|nr:mas-related G-protein coupled receptor member B4-like [Peromyscus eremicus]